MVGSAARGRHVSLEKGVHLHRPADRVEGRRHAVQILRGEHQGEGVVPGREHFLRVARGEHVHPPAGAGPAVGDGQHPGARRDAPCGVESPGASSSSVMAAAASAAGSWPPAARLRPAAPASALPPWRRARAAPPGRIPPAPPAAPAAPEAAAASQHPSRSPRRPGRRTRQAQQARRAGSVVRRPPQHPMASGEQFRSARLGPSAPGRCRRPSGRCARPEPPSAPLRAALTPIWAPGRAYAPAGPAHHPPHCPH